MPALVSLDAQEPQEDLQELLNQINNETYGLSAIRTKIDEIDNTLTQETNNINTQITNLSNKMESLSSPVYITKVSTTNGATASTTGQSPPIIVNASGADKFDLSLDGSSWTGGYNISSQGRIGLSSGVNNIRVRAYDSSVPAEKRKYAYGNILIFGL